MIATTDAAAQSTSELRTLAQGGDRTAYAELVLRYSPQMRASLRAIVGRSRHWTHERSDDIADLLQDLQMLLLSRGPVFLVRAADARDVGLEMAFRLAATRLARSYLRNGRRSAWAELPSADDVEELAVVERTEEVLVARDRLRRCFGALGDSRAEVILRELYLEGRTLEDVCRSWRVTRNSIYCVTKRFRAQVRALETPQALNQRDSVGLSCRTLLAKGAASGLHQCA